LTNLQVRGNVSNVDTVNGADMFNDYSDITERIAEPPK
jgi:hypothetical protein